MPHKICIQFQSQFKFHFNRSNFTNYPIALSIQFSITCKFHHRITYAVNWASGNHFDMPKRQKERKTFCSLCNKAACVWMFIHNVVSKGIIENKQNLTNKLSNIFCISNKLSIYRFFYRICTSFSNNSPIYSIWLK